MKHFFKIIAGLAIIALTVVAAWLASVATVWLNLKLLKWAGLD